MRDNRVTYRLMRGKDILSHVGVKFRIKDILLLDTFFNSLQKYFIKYMVFTPKDKIIKRLMITGA